MARDNETETQAVFFFKLSLFLSITEGLRLSVALRNKKQKRAVIPLWLVRSTFCLLLY